MKDKEKQIIEEMARVMQKCYEKTGLLNFKWFAESVYKYLTKDSVVLSREEIEEEIDCVKCVMIRYDSDGTKCVSYDAYKEYTDRLGDNIKKLMAKIKLLEEERNKASKETAEKILNEIDCIPTNEVNELNHLRLLKMNIAKQFGVEIKENQL